MKKLIVTVCEITYRYQEIEINPKTFSKKEIEEMSQPEIMSLINEFGDDNDDSWEEKEDMQEFYVASVEEN